MKRPIVQYIEVSGAAPSLQDNTGDADRLLREIGKTLHDQPICIPFAALTNVSRQFRQAKFSGTAIVADTVGRYEAIDFIDNFPEVQPALALDLGTTHLEAALVDLQTGKTIADGTEINGQVRYGDDILSRIHWAGKGKGALELQETVVASINQLLARLAQRAGLATRQVTAVSISGNPTMVHLLLGLDPYHLCREPYIPQVNAPGPCRGEEVGLHCHPLAAVFVLPGVGSYFGGDLVSGIIASGLDLGRQPSMLIDVGTNAEVVLGNKDWLIACAGAAGPALESGVARMGMRAGPGAIERVNIDPETLTIHHRTIGGEAPRGICGSGIIDLVASLYLSGLIDMRGKLQVKRAPELFVQNDSGSAFIVVPAEQAAGGNPVLLAQTDLDALMRSKAAMYSILTTIVNQVGLAFNELEHIYVAGAFGRHIDPCQAVTLGMLPDLPLEIFRPVGNSSLEGAKKVLLHRSARRRSQTIRQKITYVELNVNQEFMMRFSGAKFIPHTDRSLFPSVPSPEEIVPARL